MTEDEWARLYHEATRRGERLIDLDAFYAWLGRQRSDWERQGLTIEIREPTHGRPKNSLRAGITSPILAAELIVWDSGEYELDVFNPLTQDGYMSPYHPTHTLDALTGRIESELQRLGVIHSSVPVDRQAGPARPG